VVPYLLTLVFAEYGTIVSHCLPGIQASVCQLLKVETSLCLVLKFFLIIQDLLQRSGARHDRLPYQEGGGRRQDRGEEDQEGGRHQELRPHGQVLRVRLLPACRLQVAGSVP
jgi:hypothetical protein